MTLIKSRKVYYWNLRLSSRKVRVRSIDWPEIRRYQLYKSDLFKAAELQAAFDLFVGDKIHRDPLRVIIPPMAFPAC